MSTSPPDFQALLDEKMTAYGAVRAFVVKAKTNAAHGKQPFNFESQCGTVDMRPILAAYDADGQINAAKAALGQLGKNPPEAERERCHAHIDRTIAAVTAIAKPYIIYAIQAPAGLTTNWLKLIRANDPIVAKGALAILMDNFGFTATDQAELMTAFEQWHAAKHTPAKEEPAPAVATTPAEASKQRKARILNATTLPEFVQALMDDGCKVGVSGIGRRAANNVPTRGDGVTAGLIKPKDNTVALFIPLMLKGEVPGKGVLGPEMRKFEDFMAICFAEGPEQTHGWALFRAALEVRDPSFVEKYDKMRAKEGKAL